jgi:acetyl esterase/lipase
MRLLKTLPLAMLFVLAGCTSFMGKPSTPPPPPLTSEYTVERDLVYSPASWPERLLADVYHPSVCTAEAPCPMVLLIHGGGWTGPDRRDQMASIAERLAVRGYLVVNASYRFAPQYQWPAPLEDLQQALRWLRAEAPGWKGDPQKVAAFGYSAGAHLAAMLGARGNTPETRVQAVVAGGTPTDLRKYKGGTLVPQFLGGTLKQIPERFAEASPITQIKRGDPPVFLYHGNFDTLVPFDHATDYREALNKAGITNELVVIEGRGHITAFLSDGAAVRAALEFLDRQFR